MRTVILMFLANSALLGCASFDPHDLIGRHIGNTASADTRLAPAQRVEAFDFVWNTINVGYIDPKFNGVDWRAVGDRYRSIVTSAPDDQAFWKGLDQMSGELHDSHTTVHSAQRYREIRDHVPVSLSVLLQTYDGKLYAERVGSDSEAWLAGLRPGARMTRIGSEDAMIWWAKAMAQVRQDASVRSRYLYANAEFNSGKPGESVAVEFDRLDGSHVSTRIARNKSARPPFVQVLHLASGLGYLRFSSFDESIRSKTLEALKSLDDTRGIILDLRDNGGGSIFFARALASRFVKGHQDVAKIQTRDGKPVTLMFGMIDVIKPTFALDGGDKPIQQPVVILLNPASASASELLAVALQRAGRAHLIGDISCGCFSGFLGYTNVPGGGALAYTEFRFEFDDGLQIDGVGLTPDQLVRSGLADILVGRDPQFEAAVSWLTSQAQPVASQSKP